MPALLDHGKQRAEIDGLVITFREADAEALPFAEGSFDVVTSSFGVMFTPNQERAAAELLRVCGPGGKIGLANWTPESFIGQLFKTIGKHLPPPAGLKSPALWGTRDRLKICSVGTQAASRLPSGPTCGATSRRATGSISGGPYTVRCFPSNSSQRI